MNINELLLSNRQNDLELRDKKLSLDMLDENEVEEKWVSTAKNELVLWFSDFIQSQNPTNITDALKLSDQLSLLTRDQLPGKRLSMQCDEIPNSFFVGIDALLEGGEADDFTKKIYAQSLAIFTENANTVEQLVGVLSFIHNDMMVRAIWGEDLARRIDTDNEEKPLFIILIDSVVCYINENLDRGSFSRGGSDLSQSVSEFVKIKSFFNVLEWETFFRRERYFSGLFNLIDIIRLIDKEKYVSILEDLIAPQVFDFLLVGSSIECDIDEQLSLLESSLNVNSHSPEDSIVAPLLMNKILLTLKTAMDLGYNSKNPELDIDKYLLMFVAILNKYDLSGRLSFYLVVYLIRNDKGAHEVSSEDESINFKFITLLAKDYRCRKISEKNLTAFVDSLISLHECGKSRLDISFYGVNALTLLLISDEKHDSDFNNFLYEQYLRVLKIGTYSLRATYSGQSLGYADYHAGMIFVLNDNTAELWLNCWQSLVVKRRKALYYSYTKETSNQLPDLTHVYNGVAAIDMMLAGEHENLTAAKSLWLNVFTVCLTLSERFYGEEWNVIIINLYSRLPHILISDNHSVESQVAEYLNMLGGEVELIVGAINSLELNGVDIFELQKSLSLQNINLSEYLTGYINWMERDGANPSKLNVIEQAKKILADINSTLEES